MANFSMFAGDTKVLVVSVADEAGAAVNITDTLIRWELAKTVKDEPSLIYKTTPDGITIVNGALGRFDVRLDPKDTAFLKGTYYYEAEIDDAGIVSTVLTGTVDIKPVLIETVSTLPGTGTLDVTLGELIAQGPSLGLGAIGLFQVVLDPMTMTATGVRP